MNEHIFKEIKSLPPLPKSIMEIQRITNDANSSISDLVKVVKEDPMLTANLLKAANSPLYGFTKQIKSVDQAVSLFGMATVKGFAVSFAIKNTLKFDLSAYGVDENRFHDVSTKRNALVLYWYKKNRKYLDILATNSFLIDLGAVVISLVLKKLGKDNEFKSKLTIDNRNEIEKEFVGMTTAEVNAKIFTHWGFSEDLTLSMKNIDAPNGTYEKESASLLSLKTLINLLNGFNEENEKKAIEIANKYNLDTDSLNVAIALILKGND
ncbi:MULTISPECIES: HDOD domain-containing protein [unclassified Lebetimonas]|uniref:HDOD domain-containing protein n=1 Tax=unclassified Lebetimonas TaxID=2648158 RepID=UPI00046419B0|nr:MULTISPECIES: HDOD domain-containing protein [unclassified Lebetimonas]